MRSTWVIIYLPNLPKRKQTAGLNKQLNMASEDKVPNLMRNHYRLLHCFEKRQTSNCMISNLITSWETKTAFITVLWQVETFEKLMYSFNLIFANLQLFLCWGWSYGTQGQLRRVLDAISLSDALQTKQDCTFSGSHSCKVPSIPVSKWSEGGRGHLPPCRTGYLVEDG